MSTPTAEDMAAVRIEVGAMPDDTAAIPGAIIGHYWDIGGGRRLLSAALVCEWLAARAGRVAFRWTADGTTIDKTMQPGALRARAAALRDRDNAGRGITSITFTASERAGMSTTAAEYEATP